MVQIQVKKNWKKWFPSNAKKRALTKFIVPTFQFSIFQNSIRSDLNDDLYICNIVTSVEHNFHAFNCKVCISNWWAFACFNGFFRSNGWQLHIFHQTVVDNWKTLVHTLQKTFYKLFLSHFNVLRSSMFLFVIGKEETPHLLREEFYSSDWMRIGSKSFLSFKHNVPSVDRKCKQCVLMQCFSGRSLHPQRANF